MKTTKKNLNKAEVHIVMNGHNLEVTQQIRADAKQMILLITEFSRLCHRYSGDLFEKLSEVVTDDEKKEKHYFRFKQLFTLSELLKNHVEGMKEDLFDVEVNVPVEKDEE